MLFRSGGPANGHPREDGFDIVVASEVMAIFCLATSIEDLKKRLGNIVIGYTRDQKPVCARTLESAVTSEARYTFFAILLILSQRLSASS